MYVQEFDGILFVSVPYRNEGVGIAFVSPEPILWVQGRRITAGGEITVRQVPPHEFTRASFGIVVGDDRPNLEMLKRREGFCMEVGYADLAGYKWTSRLDWTLAGTGAWELAGFDVRGDGRVASLTLASKASDYRLRSVRA